MRAEEIIGFRLREVREARGWTQAQMADHLGHRMGGGWRFPQTVSAAENGDRDFRARELYQLSAALGVAVAQFFEPPAGETKIDIPSDEGDYAGEVVSWQGRSEKESRRAAIDATIRLLRNLRDEEE